MSQQTNHAYEFGPFQLVPDQRLLLRSGAAVTLSPKDMDLLLVLVESGGRLLQKDELMKQLWPESFVEEANLSHHVFMLRKALNDHGNGAIYIETVPKHGYRFVSPVREVREEDEAATITRRQSSGSGDGHAEENLSQIPDRLTSDSERKLGISPKPASQETLATQENLAPRRRLTGVVALFLLAVFLAALAVTLIPTQGRWWGSQEQMPTTLPTIQSVVVLPFTNATGDPTNEYLSDGITESLINRLSRLPRLRVVARTTAFRYKSQQVDPQTVGRQLQVSAMVTGRISQPGDSLNIQVDLVDTADGSQLWGEQYSRKMTDILAVLEEIAKQISDTRRVRLTGEQEKQLSKRDTQKAEAYQPYLKGLYFWNKRTEEGLKKGIEYFQQAIEKDPNYALAYAMLSDCYGVLSFSGYLPAKEVSQRSRAAAVKALEIDDTLAEAHLQMARHKVREWDWAGAEREYQRTIELSPSNATAHQRYSLCLGALGRIEESLAEIRRALELDPVSLTINTSLGSRLYHARQYDQAIEQCRRTLEMDPDFAQAHFDIGQVYVQQARYEDALAAFNKARSVSMVRARGAQAHALAISGRKDEARGILHELKQLSQLKYVSPYDIAVIYVGLGEKDRALAWLQKALDDGSPGMMLLKVEPVFDSLRSDPRFIALLKKMGLPS